MSATVLNVHSYRNTSMHHTYIQNNAKSGLRCQQAAAPRTLLLPTLQLNTNISYSNRFYLVLLLYIPNAACAVRMLLLAASAAAHVHYYQSNTYNRGWVGVMPAPMHACC
jgi:hypothetical protein